MTLHSLYPSKGPSPALYSVLDAVLHGPGIYIAFIIGKSRLGCHCPASISPYRAGCLPHGKAVGDEMQGD